MWSSIASDFLVFKACRLSNSNAIIMITSLRSIEIDDYYQCPFEKVARVFACLHNKEIMTMMIIEVEPVIKLVHEDDQSNLEKCTYTDVSTFTTHVSNGFL